MFLKQFSLLWSANKIFHLFFADVNNKHLYNEVVNLVNSRKTTLINVEVKHLKNLLFGCSFKI